MRDIVFRGKRIDNGEWVQSGSMIHFNDEGTEKLFYIPKRNEKSVCVHDADDNILSIEEGTFYKVIPETIGQFTGLTDKNGTKIFEGDIVKIHYDGAIWGNNREVVFEEGQWFFKDSTTTQKSYIGAWGNSVVEVIGNIHDNPELLKKVDGNG